MQNNKANSTTENPRAKKHITSVLGLTAALVLGAVLGNKFSLKTDLSSQSQAATGANITTDETKPLYWVAPMDDNYRRDQPGKSPMGMDLVPYYGNQNSSTVDEGAGTIKISSQVINNLGVRTATVTRGILNTKIETVGYVTYDEDKLVHLHSRIAGWVEKMHINAIGEHVEKDQPLYDIYSPELVNAQEELLLALDSNISRLIRSAENRLIALHVPKSTIKTIKKHKKAQQYVTFYAPQAGVVESLTVRAGLYVTPETEMLTIVDLSQVWVKAEVYERDIVQLAMGDDANMRIDSFPGKQWQGKIEHIHPMLNPQTRTGVARLHFDNANGLLKPNMFANIVIAANNNNDTTVLQVPREAVIRTGTQNRVVLALGGGSFKSVAVQIGRADRNNIEILSGLSEGEKVVTSSQFLLDSESSKNSDFKRMNADENSPVAISLDEESTKNPTQKTSPSTTPTAMVHGTVISVMPAHSMVTIDREAIEKWNREPATVDFIVSETVDMSLFTVDAYLMFTFEIRDGNFVIVNAMPMTKGAMAKGAH
ncbi:efflux RND transporter periplasmic adaptor subunit [Colwellia sp. E2M01]|uniref:efflux RND transporter periplasmic adaptor subunit n=1 Tax=Colwellia sp. E2M01 TaxID=2841561 RepID=UPI001C087360|nr:efflux RND transporter periplasmic adaptor subunit [Colwellia sp. E2M01]MBU2871871.1 efflux RND transporter periplasmic adaptor subunit [Colwellia sp. E2M01]